jgi:hypothetical protein
LRNAATISLGKQKRILTGLLVIINDMFLYLGAYKGQNWGKLSERSKPESGRKLTETAINHTHLLRIKKKRRSEGKFYPVIYFEGVRNDVVANENSKFIETHT